MHQRESERSSAGFSARLRNTVSIEVDREAGTEVRERFGRSFVAKNILMDCFGLLPDEVMALQDTGSATVFEVTFVEMGRCLRFLEQWRMKTGEECLQGLRMVPRFQRGAVPVVVRMFNPFIPNSDVELFLARHCKEVKGGTRLLDEHGFWTAKTRYAVKLKEDTRVPGGVVHLPAVFYIGPDRGIISYPGQPVYCRRCGGQGHMKSACKGGTCRFCHAADHQSFECKMPKKCSLCGEEGHLYKSCGVRSWASVAALDVETERGGQDGEQRQDGAQTTSRGPHGQEQAPGPPLQEEEGAAAGARIGERGSHPEAIKGVTPGEAGEALDTGAISRRPLVVSGAADPAPPGGNGEEGEMDSLAERAAQQTTQDVFESPGSQLSGPAPPVATGAISPALYSAESGEEEMPCLGPSAKRELPSDEEVDGSARKEQRTGDESSSTGDLVTVSESGDSSDGDSPDGETLEARLGLTGADRDMAATVTEEQEKAARDWGFEAGDLEEKALEGQDLPGSGADAAPVGGGQGGWDLSSSGESSLVCQETPSPVYGLEAQQRQPGVSSGGRGMEAAVSRAERHDQQGVASSGSFPPGQGSAGGSGGVAGVPTFSRFDPLSEEEAPGAEPRRQRSRPPRVASHGLDRDPVSSGSQPSYARGRPLGPAWK